MVDATVWLALSQLFFQIWAGGMVASPGVNGALRAVTLWLFLKGPTT